VSENRNPGSNGNSQTGSSLPAVSIVMTAYNVADYIGEAIQSALAQTFTDFELIVIDDASTDNTLDVAMRNTDPRLRLVRSPHQGAPAQMRKGVELARAPYLAFLDGDDLWHPSKLENHVAFLNAHPEVDLTFSWSRIIDERGRDTGLTTCAREGPTSFSELLADNVIGNGSALVLRREALAAAGGIDATLPAGYDLDAWLRVGLLRPGNLWAIPEFLTYYRRRRGQMTGDVALMERSFDLLVQKARSLAPDAVARVEKRAYCNMMRFYSYGCYQAGDYARSARWLARSFRRAPATFLLEPRNWKMSGAVAAGSILPPRCHTYLIRAVLKANRA
jgi:glycosyltransferase involved in cell wall biosynthesis